MIFTWKEAFDGNDAFNGGVDFDTITYSNAAVEDAANVFESGIDILWIDDAK